MKLKIKKQQEDKLTQNYSIYKKELEKLEKKYNGMLAPQDILREASTDRSPLHDWFDWHDEVAGEKWRLHQARLLLNSIRVKVMFEGGNRSYRKYLNVKVKQNGGFKRFYVETNKIMKNPDLKEQILARAINEANYWKRTYDEYQELENIFQSINKTTKKLKKRLKIKIN